MFDDPIVLETRKHREEYAASISYDLDRIVTDLQSRQGCDGRMVVDRTTDGKSEPSDARENSAQSDLKSKSTPEIRWAKLLISHGADPRVVDHTGNAALDYASHKYDADIVDLLK